MPAIRTQIYLTEEQRRAIDEIKTHEGCSLAEVIREALDEYISDHSVDRQRALKESFASCPDIRAPSRDEWERGQH